MSKSADFKNKLEVKIEQENIATMSIYMVFAIKCWIAKFTLRRKFEVDLWKNQPTESNETF